MALPPVATPRAPSFTGNLNLRKPEIGAEEDAWGGSLNGDMDLIDAVFAATGLGTSVGIQVGTGKTADMSGGTLKATADRFYLFDAADPTKQARIGLTAIPTATISDYYLPPFGDTLVGLASAQLLSNKTLVDPPAAADTQAAVSAHWVNDAVDAAIDAAIAAYHVYDTGDIIASAASAKVGWAPLHGGTVKKTGGSAASGTEAKALFDLFWSINSSTWAVSGGRGATATADWDAEKSITLPDARGFALIGTGGSIALATLFATTGDKDVALVAANLPAHTHTVPISVDTGNFGAGAPVTIMVSGGTTSTSSVGTGTAHSNVQPSMAVTYWIKL